MNSKINLSVLTLVTILLVTSCNNNPKVISPTAENDSSVKSSGIFTENTNPNNINNSESAAFGDELHKVVVNEVLPTSKYVYLNVNEGDKQYWIATGKKEIEKGETYYYKRGLLKTNFESKEYNRVFETVYLVTNLVAEIHGNSTENLIASNTKTKQYEPVKEDIPMRTDKVIQQTGSMKIADLVSDPKKYEGKTVRLTGTCTKINAGIMNRNWIHLKDGSNDDFDLVITSDAFVPEGSTVTIEALVVLDKDFGAGYIYEIILENGVIIK